ncbi:hypothetical protein Trydic_g23776 [Trypoxylus dichotomus]
MVVSPTKFTHRLSLETSISQRSLARILHGDLEMKQYHLQLAVRHGQRSSLRQQTLQLGRFEIPHHLNQMSKRALQTTVDRHHKGTESDECQIETL